MIKTNRDNIIEFILQCQPGEPKTRDGWQVDHNGKPVIDPYANIADLLKIGTFYER